MFDGNDLCWIPSIPSLDENSWRIRASQFAEGYQHRQLDGINALEQVWSLEWTNRAEADLLSMQSYLAAQQGRSFPFMHPVTGLEYYVFCDEWEVSWDTRRKGDVYVGTLSAKFEKANGAQVPQAPSWVLAPGGNYPALHVSFVNQQMWDMLGGERLLEEGLTVARNSVATVDDPDTGVWRSVPVNTLRVDTRGVLIETARTNGARNSVLAGFVPGTPGTVPTTWAPMDATGITRTIVGSGVEDGIDYVDIKWTGTNTSGGAMALGLHMNGNYPVAAVGETWTSSWFVRLMAGSYTNVDVGTGGVVTWEALSNGVAQGSGLGWGLYRAIDAPLRTQRPVSIRTLNQAGTGLVFTQYRMHVQNGAVIDITLRFGWPQIEKGSFPSTPIKTTTVAVTRPQDDLSFGLSSIFSPSEGTLFARGFITRTNTDTYGAMAEINYGGTPAERYLIYINLPGTSAASLYDNSVSQAAFSSPSPGVGEERRVAVGWKKNDFVYCANGVLQYDNSGTLGTADRIWFGKFGSGYAMDGWLSEVIYWRKKLTDAQIKSVAKY